MIDINKITQNYLCRLGVGGGFNKVDVSDVKEYDDMMINYHEYFQYYSRYGYVYFIITERKCKIGISKHIIKRINTIKNGLIDDTIRELYISNLCSNYLDVESKFKDRYKNSNICGEWYKIDYCRNYISFLNSLKLEDYFISMNDAKVKHYGGLYKGF